MATRDRTRAQRLELLEAQLQKASADRDRLRRIEEQAKAEAEAVSRELWEETLFKTDPA